MRWGHGFLIVDDEAGANCGLMPSSKATLVDPIKHRNNHPPRPSLCSRCKLGVGHNGGSSRGPWLVSLCHLALGSPYLLNKSQYACWYLSKVMNVMLAYGMTRIIIAPLPRHRPKGPSSRTICIPVFNAHRNVKARLLSTWYKILTRSPGAIVVLAHAPAMAPATMDSKGDNCRFCFLCSA